MAGTFVATRSQVPNDLLPRRALSATGRTRRGEVMGHFELSHWQAVPVTQHWPPKAVT